MTGPNPTPTPTLTPERFRDRFAIFTDTVHLASCSQGAASDELTAALDEFTDSMRRHGAPWELWMGQVEEARAGFAARVGAATEQVAVLPSASEAAHQVAATRDYTRRPRIVTTDMEFPSVAHVWLAQRARGARVHHVGHRDGVVAAEDYLAAIDERTALVSIPLVSYRNGARLPVAEVVRAAHEAGAEVFVDAYQAVGVQPVDVTELDCDFLACGALKYLLGVPGIAFLYARTDGPDPTPPALTGWFGRTQPFAFDPYTLDFPTGARRFEIGTPAIPAAYAAAAGLRTLAALDDQTVQAHVHHLVNALSDQLTADGGRLWSPADPTLRGPMVALVDPDPVALANHLTDQHIIASPRGHVLRLSLHYYNTAADLDRLCAVLAHHRTHSG